jgi:toxin-antitoxin system PIN domain toxin
VAVYLLDVNVLIALLWPAHDDHHRVQQWYSNKGHEGWATCPLTQAGFVRIVSNPAFSRDAVSPQEAVKILSANLENASHRFWPDEVSFSQAIQPFADRISGHKQVTDAYLLGLAILKKGILVTLDQSIRVLLPDKSQDRKSVEVL